MDVERSQPRKGPAREGPTVKPEGARPEHSPSPAPDDTAPHPAEASLWEQVTARENLAEALRRVEQNAGAPGIDGMSTRELRPWLNDHWPEVRSQLDAGTYRPQPVRRVMIPKPSGGMRKLGVPAVVDRLICQAIAQVLTPIFDPKCRVGRAHCCARPPSEPCERVSPHTAQASPEGSPAGRSAAPL